MWIGSLVSLIFTVLMTAIFIRVIGSWFGHRTLQPVDAARVRC